MNFYSDKIINELIDKSPLEELTDNITDFKMMTKYLLLKYSAHKIFHGYTTNILDDDENIVAFYCLDTEFCLYNCPSMLIYNKNYDYENNSIYYYILFACTKPSHRNQGYASMLLDGLTERIKQENKKNIGNPNSRTLNPNPRTIKIILSSVEEAVIFYENCGFRWTRETIANYDILQKYEKYEEGKEYFILEKIVN